MYFLVKIFLHYVISTNTPNIPTTLNQSNPNIQVNDPISNTEDDNIELLEDLIRLDINNNVSNSDLVEVFDESILTGEATNILSILDENKEKENHEEDINFEFYEKKTKEINDQQDKSEVLSNGYTNNNIEDFTNNHLIAQVSDQQGANNNPETYNNDQDDNFALTNGYINNRYIEEFTNNHVIAQVSNQQCASNTLESINGNQDENEGLINEYTYNGDILDIINNLITDQVTDLDVEDGRNNYENENGNAYSVPNNSNEDDVEELASNYDPNILYPVDEENEEAEDMGDYYNNMLCRFDSS